MKSTSDQATRRGNKPIAQSIALDWKNVGLSDQIKKTSKAEMEVLLMELMEK